MGKESRRNRHSHHIAISKVGYTIQLLKSLYLIYTTQLFKAQAYRHPYACAQPIIPIIKTTKRESEHIITGFYKWILTLLLKYHSMGGFHYHE